MQRLSNSSRKQVSFWEDAYVVLIYLYAVALPLRFNLKNVLLFVLLGVFLGLQKKNKVDLGVLKNNSFKAILAYISVCVISLFYSSNLGGTTRVILLQSSLLLLPIIVYKQLSVKQVINTLLFFSFSCFLLSIYASVITAFEYVEKIPEHSHSLATLDWTFFSYYIPNNIAFHAPYYSLYISVCLIFHSYFLYRYPFIENKLKYLLHLFFWLFFFSFLVLLSSRTALIATIVVIALVVVFLTFKARRYLLLLGVVVVTGGTSGLILQKVPYLQTKIDKNAGVSQRSMMWLSSLDIIKASPLFGVSPGDAEGALVERYRKHKFEEGVTYRYDAHNQYLMVSISIGLVGLVVFLLLLFFLLREAFVQKNFMLFSFLAIFNICCLTESLLQRKDGVLLFSFITSLLLFAPKDQKTLNQPERIADEQ